MKPIERLARAVNLEFKRQWDGHEIVPELDQDTSWSAKGGTIDLELLVKAVLQELISMEWPETMTAEGLLKYRGIDVESEAKAMLKAMMEEV